MLIAIVSLAAFTLSMSFLCSILEAVLYSLSGSQLEVLAAKGTRGARRFARYRANIDEPIAAILTVNTISHTVGATVLGWLVGTYHSDALLGAFTVAFTLAVLFLTEIVPKSVGVKYAPRLVPLLALPMQILVAVSKPIAALCSWLMKALSGQAGLHVPTEQEIIAMSKIAARVGELSPRELRWVENTLLLDQVDAEALMTPRTVVQSLFADDTVGALAGMFGSLAHNRLPVLERDDQDRVLGLVFRRDIYEALAKGERDREMRDLARRIDFVPTTAKGPELLERFIGGRRHMAAVVDEYGGFAGIVTLEDVLEAMLGAEIVDEYDEHADMQEYAREQARRRGLPGPREPGSGESGA